MSDVITELRSYRTVLDERASEVTLTEITTPAATPTRPRSSPRLALAASLAVVLVVALVILLNQSGEIPPADSVVPVTVVTPTTTPNTTPATQASGSGDGPSLVGDDEIVLAMTQSFPLRQYSESPWTRGPDEASGRTAGIRTAGDVDGPEDAENLGQFSVEFMAFETEGLASAYLEAQHEFLRVLEEIPLTGLGDEASVMAVGGDWNYVAAHGHALVRHGRFVAETVVLLDGDSDSDPEAWIAKATEVAEITDETMQAVLSSDVQPLPVPRHRKP